MVNPPIDVVIILIIVIEFPCVPPNLSDVGHRQQLFAWNQWNQHCSKKMQAQRVQHVQRDWCGQCDNTSARALIQHDHHPRGTTVPAWRVSRCSYV